jgi:uncharacterized OB-fold protein
MVNQSIRSQPGDEPPPLSDTGTVISKCEQCGASSFPPVDWCAVCLSADHLVEEAVSNEGNLYSFTEVCVQVGTFPPPFVLGYVDLDAGPRVLGRSEVPVGRLQMDQRVRIATTVASDPGDGVRVSFVPVEVGHA